MNFEEILRHLASMSGWSLKFDYSANDDLHWDVTVVKPMPGTNTSAIIYSASAASVEQACSDIVDEIRKLIDAYADLGLDDEPEDDEE